MKRERGEAFEGKGYGRLRYNLFVEAKSRIEQSIRDGYYCEAITITESIISDRLESRLSFLKSENVGFYNLGYLLTGLKEIETDPDLITIIGEIDSWRRQRNKAIHELVKIERGRELITWGKRIAAIGETAREGYQLLVRLYRRVADLNPRHTDRVF